MSVLEEILNNKKEELKQTKSSVPLSGLKARLTDVKETRPFKVSVTRGRGEAVKLIAELKKASPSEGRIREDFNVNEIIKTYDKKQVAAISVLTESRYFEGSLDYLNLARSKTEKPLLRKDFIVDDYQIYEARVNGADAVLLITAALDRSHMDDLLGLSKELSLDCLVEVHNHKELDQALRSGADIIGINNRDLVTLKTSIDTTFELLKDIPVGKVIVSESGIHAREHVERLSESNVDAILVGTTIMKAEDIGAKIDELMGPSTSSG
ncbi:MAG TPA: indole-3-glycerol phosphate synthase TrpC [Nitrospirae bacterium]|nr:indole-3-glycerol phosphate synthase TrpC [Nitrospirota bacterium]